MAGRTAGRSGRGRSARGRGGRGRGGRWKARDYPPSVSGMPVGERRDASADYSAQQAHYGGRKSTKGQMKTKPRGIKPRQQQHAAVSTEAVGRHTQTPSVFVPESKLAEMNKKVARAKNYLREMNEKYLQAWDALVDIQSEIESMAERDDLNGKAEFGSRAAATETSHNIVTPTMSPNGDEESGREQPVEISEPRALKAFEEFQGESPSAESICQNAFDEVEIKSPPTPDEADGWNGSTARTLFYTDAQGIEHGPSTEEEYQQHVAEDARKVDLARLENERMEAARVEEEERRLRGEEERRKKAEVEQQRAAEAERKRRDNERRKQLAEEEKAEAKKARELKREQNELKRKQAAEAQVEAKRKEAEERRAHIDAIKNQNILQRQQPDSASFEPPVTIDPIARTLEEASRNSGPSKCDGGVSPTPPAEVSTSTITSEEAQREKPPKRAVTVSISSRMGSSAKSPATAPKSASIPVTAKSKRVRQPPRGRSAAFEPSQISPFVYPYDPKQPPDEHVVFDLIQDKETRKKGHLIILLLSKASDLKEKLTSLEYQRGGDKVKAEKELSKERNAQLELSENRQQIARVYKADKLVK